MSPVRIAILVGALIAALAAAFVVRGIATGHETRPVIVVAPVVQKPTLKVLVAKRDLAVGDRLVLQDMDWQVWPAEGVNALYTTNGPATVAPVSAGGKLASAAGGMTTAVLGTNKAPMETFVGSAVREPMLKGEPIVASKVVKAGDAGILAVSLGAGFRAMAVPLTAESAAGGFILPGDHVDLVQSRPAEGGKGFTSSTVLNNVKVLAIDQNTRGMKSASSVVGATATLEVTPRQAEILAMVKPMGQLTMVLRSYADTDGPATVGEIHSAARNPTVRVFRNGALTDVPVAR